MKLLAVLLLLLLGMFSLSVAEVVDSFKKDCPQFFFKDKNNQAVPPTVLTSNKYKQICQFYEEEYRFATLYDTKFKIPVYSAYTYSFIKSRDIEDDYWKIEPQLDEKRTNNNKEMKQLKPEQEEVLRYQAQNKDYKDSGYTKGHVFPKSYGQSDQQKESTFTLTNAAPQIKKINTEWGEQVEIPMLNEIKGNCDQNVFVYIVTGVVPGETWLPIKRGGKTIPQGVNIPRYYWAAYSCKSKTNNNINVSNAYIAEQITPLSPENLTVDKLNQRLEYLYKTKFRVFG